MVLNSMFFQQYDLLRKILPNTGLQKGFFFERFSKTIWVILRLIDSDHRDGGHPSILYFLRPALRDSIHYWKYLRVA